MRVVTLGFVSHPMRVAAIVLLAVLTSSNAIAQAPRSSIADSLMQRWVEIYNADDVEALREFYADDVVTGNDVTGTDARGKEAVLVGSVARMTVTEGLRVEPLYSYEAGDLAYQAGRWMTHAPDGWLTGAHVFIFQRGADGQWRLQSTYYVHDPEPRLEEFASEGG